MKPWGRVRFVYTLYPPGSAVQPCAASADMAQLDRIITANHVSDRKPFHRSQGAGLSSVDTETHVDLITSVTVLGSRPLVRQSRGLLVPEEHIRPDVHRLKVGAYLHNAPYPGLVHVE